MSKIAFPTLRVEWKELIQKNRSEWLPEPLKYIEAFQAFCSKLPNNIEWRMRTVDEFRECIKKFVAESREGDAIAFFWEDIAEQIQAFSLYSIYRASNLVETTIWALNRDDYLSAALTSRAAFETAIGHAKFQITVDRILSHAGRASNLSFVEELEDEILKNLYASRNIIDNEKLYTPTNMITKVEKISEVTKTTELKETYHDLCELAHPNMHGLFIFGEPIGERDLISGKVSPELRHVFLPTIHAIGWTCFALPQTLTRLQQVVQQMVEFQGETN